MKVTSKTITPTKVKLSVTADEASLSPIKAKVLKKLGAKVKVPGFRDGTAPPNMVEKHIDEQLLQSEFVDEALNHMYLKAASEQKLRPVSQPEVTLKKFVPFTTLEFEAEVEIMGEIKLPDYKKMSKKPKIVKIDPKDVDAVIDDLKKRMAEKKDVDRASKNGDQVWIDFKGEDMKGEAIKGADGKDYPLALGSKTFIPGFEDNLVGSKKDDEKEFTLTFPKEYGVKALANKKVKFAVKVTKVQEVIEPKLDDEMAAKLGPFKTVAELKENIKKELTHEKQGHADRELESEIVNAIADKTKMELPESFVKEQAEFILNDFKQNLTYRGQTYEQYLKDEQTTEEDHKKSLRPQAEKRVRTGLVMAEISNQEKIKIDDDEIEMRINLLKGKYQDPQMQGQLDTPQARREIASQVMSEKTLDRLKQLIVKKS
ncbi:MAG: trigger factor [bacterium]|nr:trigger factor [bacterium]